jgi:hypothetical protein
MTMRRKTITGRRQRSRRAKRAIKIGRNPHIPLNITGNSTPIPTSPMAGDPLGRTQIDLNPGVVLK